MESYQERVIAEKAELDAKIEKLDAFVQGDVFGTLPPKEQKRLLKQRHHMTVYSSVLGERIVAF
jgi:hypothetical protein